MSLSALYRTVLFVLMMSTLFFIGCVDSGRPPTPISTPNTQELALNGTVLQYTGNTAGDVDNLLIESGGKRYSLHFPPHTASKIMAMAKPAAVVQVTADKRKGPLHQQDDSYELITLATGSETLTVHDIAPPVLQPGEPATISGKASDVVTDAAGKVKSFVINNTLVTLPPHINMRMATSFEKAANITVKGFKRTTSNGFVNIRRVDVIRPSSISIDSTTYTIE